MRGPVNFGFGDGIKASCFREVLTEQAVGVLVEAALP